MRRLQMISGLALYLAACLAPTVQPNPAVPWRPEAISYALQRGDPDGLYLRLTQDHDPSERIWGVVRLDLPDTWEVVRLEMVGGSLELELVDQRHFVVNGRNLSELLHAISLLGAKPRPDPDLERVWQKHASPLVAGS